MDLRYRSLHQAAGSPHRPSDSTTASVLRLQEKSQTRINHQSHDPKNGKKILRKWSCVFFLLQNSQSIGVKCQMPKEYTGTFWSRNQKNHTTSTKVTRMKSSQCPGLNLWTHCESLLRGTMDTSWSFLGPHLVIPSPNLTHHQGWDIEVTARVAGHVVEWLKTTGLQNRPLVPSWPVHAS